MTRWLRTCSLCLLVTACRSSPAVRQDPPADPPDPPAPDAGAKASGAGPAANACDPCPSAVGYAAISCIISGNDELRLCKDGHHFCSVFVTADGALAIRPHPGKDPNGWGSTLYLHAFLSGNTVLSGAFRSVQGVTASGIAVAATGPVNAPGASRYGSWSWSMTFSYDAGLRAMSTTGGTYSVSLAGQLSTPDKDLNLCRIASNYLTGVPLLDASSPTGDTGDMDKVLVSGGLTYTWLPPSGSTYPKETTAYMTIDVKGQHNIVDTAAQGWSPIKPAYKPSLSVSLVSQSSDIPMIFGAGYDVGKHQDFTADNVSITPIVLKTWSRAAASFNVELKSIALADDAAAFPGH